MSPKSLTPYAWLSVLAALLTIALKSAAYWLTGSVGLLSDAIESIVNLLAALMALAMLTIAERPADENHAHGHGKAEYFSSGFEGMLILVAALAIGVTAVDRLLAPKPLQQLDIGLLISVAASLINLLVALILFRIAKQFHSVTLEADAQHLMTDVWTSVGVIVGVGAVALTGWQPLDPLIALAVAANIVWTGVKIFRQAIDGLMDSSLPADEKNRLVAVLERYRVEGIEYHALRTRRSGMQRFVSLHVMVPGCWTVLRGHRLLERLEGDLKKTLPHLSVISHLEALDDPASWDEDAALKVQENKMTPIPSKKYPSKKRRKRR